MIAESWIRKLFPSFVAKTVRRTPLNVLALEDRLTPTINLSVPIGGTLDLYPVSQIFPPENFTRMDVLTTTVPGLNYGTMFRVSGAGEYPWGTTSGGTNFAPGGTNNQIPAGSGFRYVNAGGTNGQTESIPVMFFKHEPLGAGTTKLYDTLVITIGSPGTPPQITQQPTPLQTVAPGQTVTWSVTATGDGPLSYQWFKGLVPNAANPIPGATLSTYTTEPIFDTSVQHFYWVRVSNNAGVANSHGLTINISNPPVVNIGGPYTFSEMQSGQLDASASYDPDPTNTIGFDWNLDNDILFGEPAQYGDHGDENGAKVLFNVTSELDGPSTYPIALKVFDNTDNVVTVNATVTIANAGPKALFTGTGAGNQVIFSNLVDSAADLAAGLLYSYDFDYDGVFEITDSKSASAAVPAAYLARYQAGDPVRGRVKDKDGGSTDYAADINGRVIVVSTTADENDANTNYELGSTSLREAMALAEKANDADRIVFDPALFAGGSIMVGGSFDVSTPVVLSGPRGNAGVTLSGTLTAANQRAFQVTASGTLTLERLTVKDYAYHGPNNTNFITGGAVFNQGNMTIRDCAFVGNSVTGNLLGGVYRGVGVGGAVASMNTLTVIGSTFTGNSAKRASGGTLDDGSVRGGAIYAENTLKVTNVTISENTAEEGRGVFILGSATINNSIVAQADTIGYDLVAYSGSTTGGANNIIGKAQGFSGAAVSTNPLLNPLANNGGPTPTLSIGHLSPAINAGNDTLAAAADQRGRTRIVNSSDIGAYESGNSFVGNLSDIVDGNFTGNNVSLREAILLANDDPVRNGITFAPGLSGTITLGGTMLPAVRGGILDITGPGSGQLTISGNNQSRIFHVANDANLGIASLTIANGKEFNGGAVYSEGGVSFSNAVLSNNTASFNGGAVYQAGGAAGSILYSNYTAFTGNSAGNAGGAFILVNKATAYVMNSALNGNTAFGEGGAIENYSGTLNVMYSTFANNVQTETTRPGGAAIHSNDGLMVTGSGFSNNISANGGGAMSVNGTTEISNSGFTGNQAATYGGGLWNFGSLTVRDSTFRLNSAVHGGAIQSWGDGNSKLFVLENSTLAGNTAVSYGAMDAGSVTTTVTHVTIADNVSTSGTGAVKQYAFPATYTNTIVARNTGGALFTENGGAISGWNNLIGPGGSAGLLNGVNGNLVGVSDAAANLGALTQSGLQIWTIPLLPFSPAINAGKVVPGITSGQNGNLRGNTPDIGAYESTYQTPTDITLSNATVNSNQPTGSVVGTFTTHDLDSFSHTYTLVSGSGDSGNAHFSISGNQLKTAGPLTQPAYSIRVFSIDSAGLSVEKIFNIAVNLPPTVVSAIPNDGSSQRSRISQLRVTFSTVINPPYSSFTLERIGAAGNNLVSVSVNLAGSTATQTIADLTFSGSFAPNGLLVDGNYRLSVNGYSTPGGLSGAATNVMFHRLFGDADGNATVDALDLAAFGTAFGTTAVSNPYDFNTDGAIDAQDLAEFGNRFGMTL